MEHLKVFDIVTEYPKAHEFITDWECNNNTAKRYTVGRWEGEEELDAWLIENGAEEDEEVILFVSW